LEEPLRAILKSLVSGQGRVRKPRSEAPKADAVGWHYDFETRGDKFCAGTAQSNDVRVMQVRQSLRTAIDISRKQKAKSWELRATTSLSRLLVKRGKRDEARAMLAEIYGWFTEGFDTADLKDAKALLEELNG